MKNRARAVKKFEGASAFGGARKAALALFFGFSVHWCTSAGDLFWTGATSSFGLNTNWNTVADGSGVAPIAAPGVADAAIFTGFFTANCDFSANVSVLGFTIQAGYSGTINQNTRTLTVGATGFSQAAGIFGSGTAAIVINGPFALSGGAFTTATTTTTSFAGGATVSGGTLTTSGTTTTFGGTTTINGGTVNAGGTTNSFSGATTVSSGTLSGGGAMTWAAGAALTVSGTGVVNANGATVTFTSPASLSVGGGTYNAMTSSMTVGGAFNVSAGTFNANTATITANGANSLSGTGQLNGGSGNMTLVGATTISGGTFLLPSTTLTVRGNWTITGGTLDLTNDGTVLFGAALTINGSHTLNNVTFNDNSATANTYSLVAGTTLIVNKTLTLSNGITATAADAINTGTLRARGNIGIVGVGCGGSADLIVEGAAAQALSSTNLNPNQGELPKLTINNPGQTLTLSGIIRTLNNWTYTAGTLDPGTSTVVFASSLIISGSHALNHVIFNDNVAGTTSTYTLLTGTTLTVNGALTLSNAAGATSADALVTGTVSARGDIFQVGAACGGNADLIIDGGGPQTFTGSGDPDLGDLPNLIINNPGQTLSLASIIRTFNNWTYTAGTVDATTLGSTVVFADTLNISGSHTLNHVTFSDNSTTANTYTVVVGTTLTVKGNLVLQNNLGSTGADALNFGTLMVEGNVTQSAGVGVGGTATIVFSGGNNQVLTGNSTSTVGSLPAIQINKSGNTLTLQNTIRTTNNWTYTAGLLDPGTSTVVFANTLTIGGNHTLGNVTFNDNTTTANTYSLVMGTTLTVSGTLTFANSLIATGADTINTGTLRALGDVVQSAGVGVVGTAVVEFSGGAAQTFTGNSTLTTGNFPAVLINKNVGTDLNLQNIIRVNNNWTYQQGNVVPGGSTVIFASTLTISGSHSLGNVMFSDNATGASTYTIVPGTTLTVGGTLTLNNSVAAATADALNLGTLLALGDVIQAVGVGVTGTTTIVFGGPGPQQLQGNSTLTLGSLPRVQFNTASTVTLTGIIRTANDWTYTAGTLTTAGTTVVYAGTLTITGSHTLNEVVFNGGSVIYTLALGTTLSVTGNVACTDGRFAQTAQPAAGTVNVQGNVTVGPLWDNADSGLLVFSGAGAQTFDLTGSEANFNASVTVNKSGGTLTMLSSFSATNTGQNVTLTAGLLDLGGFDFTVTGGGIFSVASGATLRMRGGQTVTAPSLQPGSLVVYTGDGDTLADTFTINSFAFQNLTIAGTDGSDTFALPAAVTVAQDLTVSSGSLDASASNFGLTVGGDWAFAGGTFVPRSGTVTFVDNTQTTLFTGSSSFFNLTCVTASKNLTFTDATTQTLAGTLTLNGQAATTRQVLRSSAGGVWNITPNGARDIRFVDVQDSTNLAAAVCRATDSVDSGSNIFWDFSNVAPTVVGPTALPAAPLVGELVTLGAVGSDANVGDTLTYAWDFGDGTTLAAPASPNPTHTYAAAGTYNVVVTVNDGFVSVTGTLALTVFNTPPPPNSAPVPFSPTAAAPTTADTGVFISFTTLFSDPDGDTLTYSWNFGDGSGSIPSTAPNATHAYLLAGTYTATVTASDGLLSATGSVTVTITVPPDPGAGVNDAPAPASPISLSPAAPGTNEAVTFNASYTDADGDALSYTWNFGDGTSAGPSTSASATHTYASAGSYNVILTVSDGKVSVTSAIVVSVVNAASSESALLVKAAKIKLNFGTGGALDTISMKGFFDLAPGLPISTATLTASLDVGAVSSGDQVLDKKGKDQTAGTHKLSLKLKTDGANFKAGPTAFTYAAKSDDFATALAAAGLTNETVLKTVVLPVTFRLNGAAFSSRVALLYKGTANKSGQAK